MVTLNIDVFLNMTPSCVEGYRYFRALCFVYCQCTLMMEASRASTMSDFYYSCGFLSQQSAFIKESFEYVAAPSSFLFVYCDDASQNDYYQKKESHFFCFRNSETRLLAPSGLPVCLSVRLFAWNNSTRTVPIFIKIDTR